MFIIVSYSMDFDIGMKTLFINYMLYVLRYKTCKLRNKAADRNLLKFIDKQCCVPLRCSRSHAIQVPFESL